MSYSLVISIVFIAIIGVIFFVYAYYAFNNNMFPFENYKPNPPPNAVLYKSFGDKLTNDEIKIRKENAYNLCIFLKSSENFMTSYCGRKSNISIDCSSILEL